MQGGKKDESEEAVGNDASSQKTGISKEKKV
jgi:hypothetical protein